ncbi:MAG: hypothetical protein ACYDFU_02345 [Nitrospirota bacterium]
MFSPPLIAVSRFNSQKELLAVQLSKKGDQPARIIAINRRGGLRVVEDLTTRKTLTVPGSRLWIAGMGNSEAVQSARQPAERSRRLPVINRRVWLAKSGECYAVAYLTSGGWYELRYMDKDGKLLFISAPKDNYGLASVIVSDDGSRVLVDDETPPFSMTKPGQRLYLYDKNGKLLMDRDAGENLRGWLETADGFMAADGSYFAAPMGMGRRVGSSIVLMDGNGKQVWDKAYFPRHVIEADLGGLFRVRGGNLSFIYLIDKGGGLKTIARKGYGFELMLSKDSKKAYMLIFKPFDVEKSGLSAQIKSIFPAADVVTVNLPKLLPDRSAQPATGANRPAGAEAGPSAKVALAPDGKSFICYASRAAMGMSQTTIMLFGENQSVLWKKDYFQPDVVPEFTGGGEFILKFGYPIKRLAFFAPE